MNRAIMLGVFVLVSLIPAASAQVSDRLFQCIVLSTNTLLPDGRLGSTPYLQGRAKVQNEFVYDDASQTLRWEMSDSVWRYKRVQEGTDQNGLVAVRLYEGGASVVVDVLRIKTYEKSWPFLLMEQDEISTGTCKKF